MRRLIIGCLLLCGCGADRPRPDPTGVAETLELIAGVHAPENNATILGAKPLEIRIFGSEQLSKQLTGVAYVVRRNGETVDSLAVNFPARADTVVVFPYQVPDFPTNTHLEIFGLAFGSDGSAAVSAATLVTVIRCTTGIPGC